jgi:Arc/MetJ family transcription regulator
MATNLAIDDDLITEAQRMGSHRTKREAVTAALQEYIQRRKQQRILKYMGTVEFHAGYDHKKLRRSR